MDRKARLDTAGLALRAAAIAMVLAVVVVGMGSSQPARADSSGLAYDEIVRVVMAGMSGMPVQSGGNESSSLPEPGV